jgi:hypothetical protein
MSMTSHPSPAKPQTSTKDKSLTGFIATVQRNQQGNLARFPVQYDLIRRVDKCFVDVSAHLAYAKPVFAAHMFLRSHYAYKTAASMTLAGQVPESFVMMRSCLEYAGYALAIFADPGMADVPSREEVFVNRHVDATSMKAQKEEFKIGKIVQEITAHDQKLANTFQFLYQRSIDYGGHPNPHGMLTAMSIDKEDDKFSSISITTLALTLEPLPLQFAMKSAAQVGLTSLYIFQQMFKAKFELLRVRAEMDALRQAGL